MIVHEVVNQGVIDFGKSSESVVTKRHQLCTVQVVNEESVDERQSFENMAYQNEQLDPLLNTEHVGKTSHHDLSTNDSSGKDDCCT